MTFNWVKSNQENKSSPYLDILSLPGPRLLVYKSKAASKKCPSFDSTPQLFRASAILCLMTAWQKQMGDLEDKYVHLTFANSISWLSALTAFDEFTEIN